MKESILQMEDLITRIGVDMENLVRVRDSLNDFSDYCYTDEPIVDFKKIVISTELLSYIVRDLVNHQADLKKLILLLLENGQEHAI